MTFESIIFASLAGILPALIWLAFLLREDSRSPEPRRLIAYAFMAGMAAVALALPLEAFAEKILNGGSSTLIAWAVIEEVLKYALVAAVVLWRKNVDEPLDYVIYMLTAALGFAAVENALFMLTPFSHGDVSGGLLTENLRFVGSTLLHVLASSIIGFSLAFAYMLRPYVRSLIAIGGLILAVALHAVFNFLIISEDGSRTTEAFFTVWTGAVVLFALFEVLKYFEYRHLPKHP